jgi:hypothetical protein
MNERNLNPPEEDHICPICGSTEQDKKGRCIECLTNAADDLNNERKLEEIN